MLALFHSEFRSFRPWTLPYSHRNASTPPRISL
ncbi:unnamed protein product [Spirodela intermedia]|uniref:Uncharacterized protein n=2 Tax=Spirodela intermedia TaxID=51605 RepID=A0A7I8J3F7_SPIIN|nr:unnamed protein product [Spirodela intermedia]CAA6664333.1 unnamed protein product [Spirodela intermedia]CAA7400899.1 unnamed protein product [Spirodela intermedia]